MNAAGAQVNAAASNIANAETDGYKAVRVDTVALSDGAGVGWSASRDPAPGPVDAGGNEGSNVDPITEAVNLKRAKGLYDANAMVVKTADKMVGSLLDILHGDPGRKSDDSRRRR